MYEINHHFVKVINRHILKKYQRNGISNLNFVISEMGRV